MKKPITGSPILNSSISKEHADEVSPQSPNADALREFGGRERGMIADGQRVTLGNADKNVLESTAVVIQLIETKFLIVFELDINCKPIYAMNIS